VAFFSCKKGLSFHEEGRRHLIETVKSGGRKRGYGGKHIILVEGRVGKGREAQEKRLRKFLVSGGARRVKKKKPSPGGGSLTKPTRISLTGSRWVRKWVVLIRA